MISKYAYKNLTWVDMLSPNENEIQHVLESYPNKHLHFIIGDNFLITTRKIEDDNIKKFAKDFEMNVDSDMPIQTETIDALFFSLINIFKKHNNNIETGNDLSEKIEELQALEYTYKTEVKKYKQKINYLKGMLGVLFFISIIIILILWL